MHKLLSELQRLYFLPGQNQTDSTTDLDLVSPEGQVRLLLMNFKRSSDWPALSEFCQALQDDFELPTPAISIAGEDGFQLWFSLAEPVTLEQGSHFLAALQRKYLSGIPAHHLQLRPSPGAASPTCSMIPMQLPDSDRWLAFIDPSLGSMFMDEQWLEIAPNMDQQANMLASRASIKRSTFLKVIEQLPAEASSSATSPSEKRQNGDAAAAAKGSDSWLNIATPYADPVSFLLAVMNDTSASARQRIRAAKALLPYFPPPAK